MLHRQRLLGILASASFVTQMAQMLGFLYMYVGGGVGKQCFTQGGVFADLVLYVFSATVRMNMQIMTTTRRIVAMMVMTAMMV